jgi:ABC-2 type transport system permease protein
VIGTVLRISWLSLVRDRWALVLSFFVPIAFFSILALVFGGFGGNRLPPIRVAVLDADGTDGSARLVRALQTEPALVVEPRALDGAAAPEETAAALVRHGDVPAAIVVPAGFGDRLARFPAEQLTVALYGDRASDPIAYAVVSGLLQRAVVTAAPDRLVDGLTRWIEREAGPLTPPQRGMLADIGKSMGGATPDASPFRVDVTDVQAPRGREGRKVVSYYAASIGVMFLLFTMTSAMRGLLVEQETGTLERLLSTDLTMSGLLFGRWLFATALGCAQLAVMFLWGWSAFGVELFARDHLVGVAVMTVTAAAAAATFGMVLGTACRTQAQLNGLSTVLILLMSALGGSMVPRYMMPEGMQQLGLATFNAWAVVGFQKVFWRDAPVAALWPELTVLGAMTLVGLAVARTLARRWESV